MRDDSPEVSTDIHKGRPVLVTGGNGQIALQLFERLAKRGIAGRAVVRSERAASQVAQLPEDIRPDVRILDYRDTAALTKAADGCRAIVHLVGILKEASGTSYADAHENTCTAVASAGSTQGLSRVVYLSIFGSRPDSNNACLASKGRAEEILKSGSAPTTLLRVPMVVGPDDPASRALRAQSRKPHARLIGGGKTIQQPLDIQDLLSALVAAVEEDSDASHSLDLGGPEALPHHDLVRRVGKLHGNEITVSSIPLFAVRAAAHVMKLLMKNPPITPGMLGVLQHDDRIDNREAESVLGIKLTPLDDTLARYIGPQAGTHD